MELGEAHHGKSSCITKEWEQDEVTAKEGLISQTKVKKEQDCDESENNSLIRENRGNFASNFHITLILSIASKSQSIPRPGSFDANAKPVSMAISVLVIIRSCGMCSTYSPLGIAQARFT
jgi:hypothetical protein